jgi:hypothetical protein
MTVTVVDIVGTFRPHDSVRRDGRRGVSLSVGPNVASLVVALPVGADQGEGHTLQAAPARDRSHG